MTQVAVLGQGRMGVAVTRRLRATGHDVTAWSRSLGTSATAAVAGADVVIVVVTDAAAVEEVLFGPTDGGGTDGGGADGGAAGAMRTGAVVVQMSTISPAQARQVARRCPPHVALIDAPVKGSVPRARTGTLTVLAGGDDDAIDRAQPVLDVLGDVQRCGAVGAGSAVKLVLNAALITSIAALADVMTVADAVGVDRSRAWDVLASSTLGAAVRRARAAGADFPIALAAKDAGLAVQPSTPVLRAAAEVLRAAPDRQADLATLIRENS